jgi:hypothetical protein
MRTKPMTVALLLCAVLSDPPVGRAETAAESFARGETLLAKGDCAAALQSYAAAARADRNNPEYVQHYAMLRRIVDLRTRLETEQNPQLWEQMARAVRAFYASERVYAELLMLDRRMHSRLGSGESATMLAETQLAMGEHADAAQTLSALPPAKATAMTQALLGIALVRSGKTDEAKQIAEKLTLPADARPGLTYAAARLYAGIGNSARSLELLGACFETTLPSMLDGFKAHAKDCSEFAAMASSPEFTQALKTKSKLSESKCSGGSSCAGCPMSGKCPRSQGKQ